MPTEDAAAVERAEEVAATARRTILVVDDEAMVRAMAAAALEEFGYAIVTASDGREGVERFRAAPERFDLVLIDLAMPVMDGAEAIVQLRAVRPSVPIVVMSGYGESETLERVAGLGAAAVVPKPFTIDALASAVRAAID